MMGEQGERNSPRRRVTVAAPNHCGGGAKTPNNVTSSFFNTVHLLPENLIFEHGGARLASYPGRHLT